MLNTTSDTFASLSLANRVAVVTGASSGIGAAIAILLAERGASVAVSYQSNARGAETVVEEIVRAGGRAIAVSGDVGNEEHVAAIVRQVTEHFGPIGILVNNAGRNFGRGGFLDLGVAAWDKGYTNNLRSVVLMCQAVLPQMLAAKWGRVINISSVSTKHGSAKDSTYYAALKACLDTLTLGLGREYAAQGVLVNAVAPGLIDTPFHAPNRARAEGIVQRIPIGRMGRPEEVAEMVAYLASPANSLMAGEVVDVSGGY